ncbi:MULTISPECIES: AbrB/MazE/SpoVT family DNA-binding domain-containing protein [Methanobacterium]|uniref:SpoVT-AbrB domain-containing protein n=1 Tax=Methanobacterium veterum TaxID=408577 RepID=A0A9E4ZYA5_9EURY|nr:MULTISPECIES: hypothetical protein [Methanobacterium]MCZ3365673.1 hypothetical protein [Methanobacterium veterum]MCZ3371137.1 hypothetical protein [Methanobacterium veterum]
MLDLDNTVVKQVDNQGRIVLPKKWRNEHLKSSSVKLQITDGEIHVFPYEPEDISDLFGSIEIDLESDRSDWKAMKKELIVKGSKRK